MNLDNNKFFEQVKASDKPKGQGGLAPRTGSAATPYELKSLGADYYVCLRDTETPLAKILRSTSNKELIELKQYLDGKMPPNADSSQPASKI